MVVRARRYNLGQGAAASRTEKRNTAIGRPLVSVLENRWRCIGINDCDGLPGAVTRTVTTRTTSRSCRNVIGAFDVRRGVSLNCPRYGRQTKRIVRKAGRKRISWCRRRRGRLRRRKPRSVSPLTCIRIERGDTPFAHRQTTYPFLVRSLA